MPAYIDHKLASFESFSTPTYFRPPFAKPVKHSAGPQPHANGAILVEAKELPRYGFQGSTTPQDAYRKGLATLDKVAKKKHGHRFINLDEPTQTKLLADLEDGKVAAFKKSKDFFKMVLEDVYEGMFSDPVYGGNRDLAGWKLVGYPGAQRAYNAARAHARASAQARAGPARHAGDEPGRATGARDPASRRHAADGRSVRWL